MNNSSQVTQEKTEERGSINITKSKTTKDVKKGINVTIVQ